MQQDHAESKAEEKSPGAPGRGKVSPEVTAQARAVLNLQRTAGNRAMARILGAPAGGATVLRTASDAVSVQRDEWTDALKKELGTSRVIPFEALAKTLVRAHRESPGGQPKAVTDKSGEKSGDVTGSKLGKVEGGKAEAGSTEPVTDKSVADKRLEMRSLEERLQKGPSKLELENEELDRQLRALRAEQAQSESLRAREAGLLHQPSAAEKANQTKKAELDRIERRQELAEAKRKLSGRLTPEEQADRDLDEQFEQLKKHQALAEFERQRKPLNPRGKSLPELMKGGPRVWRG
jgi:hypothetical protein